jgi:hypothetical protein
MNRYRDPAGGIRMPVRNRNITIQAMFYCKELNCVDFTAYRAISSITPGNRRCVPSSIVGHRYAASQAEEASFNGHFRPHTGKSFTIGKPFRIVPDSQIVRIMPGRPEMPRIPVVPADSVE